MKQLLLLIALISLSDRVEGQSSSWQPASGSNFMQYCNWCIANSALYAYCAIYDYGSSSCHSQGGVIYDVAKLCSNNLIQMDLDSPELTFSCTQEGIGAVSDGYDEFVNKCPKACNGNCIPASATPFIYSKCFSSDNMPISNQSLNNKEVKK